MAEIIAELVSLGNNVIVKLIKLGWNAKEEVMEFKQNLEVIESYLHDAQTKQSVEVVEQWIQKLGSVSVKARKELDELEKIIDWIANWNYEGAIPGAMSAGFRVFIGYKVSKINQKLMKILNMGTALGLQTRVNLASSSSFVKNKPNFFTKIPRWLWRKMKKVINKLRRSDYSRRDYNKMTREF